MHCDSLSFIVLYRIYYAAYIQLYSSFNKHQQSQSYNDLHLILQTKKILSLTSFKLPFQYDWRHE